MTKSRDLETRERLLKAAERLFADRGFKNVTVRDICRVARANVAAVNYHFGDKLGLYREVLQSAIAAMRETNDTARQAGAGRRPEEQLRRYIVIFVHRLLKNPVQVPEYLLLSEDLYRSRGSAEPDDHMHEISQDLEGIGSVRNYFVDVTDLAGPIAPMSDPSLPRRLGATVGMLGQGLRCQLRLRRPARPAATH